MGPEDITDYAKRYLNLALKNYTVIWWKHFNVVDYSKLQNILTIVEVLFCLRLTNDSLEKLFSQLKSDRQRRLVGCASQYKGPIHSEKHDILY